MTWRHQYGRMTSHNVCAQDKILLFFLWSENRRLFVEFQIDLWKRATIWIFPHEKLFWICAKCGAPPGGRRENVWFENNFTDLRKTLFVPSKTFSRHLCRLLTTFRGLPGYISTPERERKDIVNQESLTGWFFLGDNEWNVWIVVCSKRLRL